MDGDLYALDKIGLKYGRFDIGIRVFVRELLARSTRLDRLFIRFTFSIHIKVGYVNYHTIHPCTNILQLITGYSSTFEHLIHHLYTVFHILPKSRLRIGFNDSIHSSFIMDGALLCL